MRHSTGDWGDLDAKKKRANDDAVMNGDRILSAYNLCTGARIWIITEADRSATREACRSPRRSALATSNWRVNKVSLLELPE
jgi:hypothetical protein